MKYQEGEPQPIGDALKWFIGSLSAEEAAEFESATESTRQIDPDVQPTESRRFRQITEP